MVALAAPAPERAVDHIVVKFKPHVAGELGSNSLPRKLEILLERLRLPSGARLEEPAINHVLRARSANAPERNELNLERFLYLRVPAGLSVDECVRRVAANPSVEYAEPDGMGSGGLIPNDPSFSSQWHHRNVAKPSASIQTPLAWDMTQGTTNVIIAVLDSGLNATADSSGRVVAGYNFVSNNSNTADDHPAGHGTAVAATVAASGNNGTLIAGVDWRCRVMPVKVLDDTGSGLYTWWAQGIDFAVNNGARIINLAAGGSGTSATLANSINNAIAQGVIFVTITHNDGTNVIRFPGNLATCITVGATDEQDRRAGFSNYGPGIDLCAPGTNIYTIGASGSVGPWWGTSFAAPQAAGVCGLMLSVRPNLNHEQARLLLCAGADDAVGDGTDTPGFDNYYGWGRLNAYNSLILAQTRVDRLQWSNGLPVLSWRSPPNAANKQPYQVDFQNTLTGSWTTVTSSSQFAYTTNRTSWTDTNGVSTTRFYRVRLRGLP